jgi:hypothetical protein
VSPELLPADTDTCSRHLAVEADDLAPALRANADVLFLPSDGGASISGEPWHGQVQALLSRYPHCTIIATVASGMSMGLGGRCRAFVRGFGPLSLTIDQILVDPAVLPSILLALIRRSGEQEAVAALRSGVSVWVAGIQATVSAYESAVRDPRTPC